MVINVSEALDSDTSQIVTVERSTGGYVNGRYVVDAPTTFKTLCSVQQPSPKELQNLPKGERDKDIMLFISKKPLRTVSDRDEELPDVVLYKGKRYKMIANGDWEDYGHNSCFGARMK